MRRGEPALGREGATLSWEWASMSQGTGHTGARKMLATEFTPIPSASAAKSRARQEGSCFQLIYLDGRAALGRIAEDPGGTPLIGGLKRYQQEASLHTGLGHVDKGQPEQC